MTTTSTYGDFCYDAPVSILKPVDVGGVLTNMTYDPGPHPPKKVESDVDEPTVVEPPRTN